MSNAKRCFVISPIGQPASDVREEADAVFDFIIEPTLRQLSIEAVRADKFPEPGLITEQMIAAILDFDLCIADLSGNNPNVFYELALAQAAERPVVLLKRIGEDIPFDVKDYRLLEYDLKPRSIRTDRWIPVLKEQVQKVLAASYRPPKLLRGRNISHSDGVHSYLINARSEEFGEAPRYHEVVQQAGEYCYLMGISLKVWGGDDGRRVLDELVRRPEPINVKVLIMDAEHPALPAVINNRLPAEDVETVRRQTARMARYFAAYAEASNRFEFRTLREGLAHFQLIVTDKTALVLQYMLSRGTTESPLQQLPAGSKLHRAFKEEFEALWALNGT